MNRLAVTLMITSLTLATTQTWAGSGLPEPSSSRIILHGVDCSIETRTVCNEERPVFDEAIVSVSSTAVVRIETRVAEGLGGEPTGTLPRASADAVRDYFIDAGIPPEQVEIHGCTATPGLRDWIQPIDVQLAKSFQNSANAIRPD